MSGHVAQPSGSYGPSRCARLRRWRHFDWLVRAIRRTGGPNRGEGLADDQAGRLGAGLELVDSLAVARLATVEADGQPHVVPICFVVLDDALYSVVDEKPKLRRRGIKRLRNLAANPHATVVADRYDSDWTRLAWVMLVGRAAEVADEGEYSRAIVQLTAKYPQYRPTSFARADSASQSLAIIRIPACRVGSCCGRTRRRDFRLRRVNRSRSRSAVEYEHQDRALDPLS